MDDVRSYSGVKSLEMEATADAIPKIKDVSKYNLRCNRNISGKMRQKDFVYDTTRRPFRENNKPLRNGRFNAATSLRYLVVPTTTEIGPGGDASMHPMDRLLDFKCNFCSEPIATISSLSTHVKSHCRRYCKKCYWILGEGETVEEHTEKMHLL